MPKDCDLVPLYSTFVYVIIMTIINGAPSYWLKASLDDRSTFEDFKWPRIFTSKRTFYQTLVDHTALLLALIKDWRPWWRLFAINLITTVWIPECRQTLTRVFGPPKSRLHRIVDRPSALVRGQQYIVTSCRLLKGKCSKSDRKPNDVSSNICCASDVFFIEESERKHV